MNPLYTAHIVADFLLQTKRLAAWKSRSFWGLAAHCLIHAAVLAIFILPFEPSFYPIIFAAAAIHGVVDFAKIQAQKKSKFFGPLFFTDQIIHFITLVAISSAAPTKIEFWNSAKGMSFSLMLFAATFTLAVFNLLQIASYPVKTKKNKLKRIALISAVFILFLTPSLLFSFSTYF